MFCDYSMIVMWHKIDNSTLSLAWHEWLSCIKAACRLAFQVWKFNIVTWQARSKNCTKKHSAHGPRLYFLIQAIKSFINMSLSLPFMSLFLKHPTYTCDGFHYTCPCLKWWIAFEQHVVNEEVIIVAIIPHFIANELLFIANELLIN